MLINSRITSHPRNRISQQAPESTTLVTTDFGFPEPRNETFMEVATPYVAIGMGVLGAKLGWSAGLNLGSAVGGAATGWVAGGLAGAGASADPVGPAVALGSTLVGAGLTAAFTSASPLVGGAAGFLVGGLSIGAYKLLS